MTEIITRCYLALFSEDRKDTERELGRGPSHKKNLDPQASYMLNDLASAFDPAFISRFGTSLAQFFQVARMLVKSHFDV